MLKPKRKFTMKLSEIAYKINELSYGYKIHYLQRIRKKIKGKSPGGPIFRAKTISNSKGYAYHYGGLTELQFNIGFEDEGFRYGVAVSLQPTQELPDVTKLYPKISKLNCVIDIRKEFFKDYRMWHWNKVRSPIKKVTTVNPEIVCPGTFIFLGKIVPVEKIDISEVIKTFDALLDVYIAVEQEFSEEPLVEDQKESFEFGSNATTPTIERKYRTQERELSFEVRHILLQDALVRDLLKTYGEGNVCKENTFGRNRIDVVVNHNQEYYFYEVKVAGSAKSCLRQALGQLMEYAYWPGKRHAKKIVVAGEHPLDENSRNYLSFLRESFNLPVEYKQITISGD